MTHVITGLDVGGAEMVLYQLLLHARERMGDVSVIGLRDDGPMGDMIRELGVPVTALGLEKDIRQLRGVGRVAGLLRTTRSEVVQTWMYHADVLGGLAGRRAGASVVWGVHAGAPVEGRSGLWMKLGARMCGLMSHRLPDKIVCSSQQSFEVHRKLGFVERKMVLIPNGFGGLMPERRQSRHKLLAELDLSEDVRLVVRVARLHRVKDHPVLLRAFRVVLDRNPKAHLLLVGEGMSATNQEVTRLASDPVLAGHVHLLGPRGDVAEIVAGCDLAVSSSRVGEGLPLVIGEAMAVGTPVVATDVGDSGRLIDDPARVVPPRLPEQLAAAIDRFLNLDRGELAAVGDRDMQRVRTEYGIERMADAYLEVYEQVRAERSVS